jgi:Na+/H+-dicarboxylate symporter
LARDARRAPLDAFAVLRGGAPAFAAAFATDSSSAALPKTIQCALDLRVPASIAKFSLPLGATLNMNGTALYEALTVLFVAQVHEINLSLGQTLVVALTSTVAAVGAAAIPSAGLVTMFMVLQAAGLGKYGDDVGALLALDWFLDRARTVVNVEGDLFVAAALAAWEAPPDETEEPRWVSEGDVGDVSR